MGILQCIDLVFLKYYPYYTYNMIPICFIILSSFPAIFHLLHKPDSLDTINFLTFSEHNILHELAQLFILLEHSSPMYSAWQSLFYPSRFSSSLQPTCPS